MCRDHTDSWQALPVRGRLRPARLWLGQPGSRELCEIAQLDVNHLSSMSAEVTKVIAGINAGCCLKENPKAMKIRATLDMKWFSTKVREKSLDASVILCTSYLLSFVWGQSLLPERLTRVGHLGKQANMQGSSYLDDKQIYSRSYTLALSKVWFHRHQLTHAKSVRTSTSVLSAWE